MTHYETRSYQAWHRHMLLVMVAQLFITVLRRFFKKTLNHYDAYGILHYRFADPDPYNVWVGFEDCSLSAAS